MLSQVEGAMVGEESASGWTAAVIPEGADGVDSLCAPGSTSEGVGALESHMQPEGFGAPAATYEIIARHATPDVSTSEPHSFGQPVNNVAPDAHRVVPALIRIDDDFFPYSWVQVEAQVDGESAKFGWNYDDERLEPSKSSLEDDRELSTLCHLIAVALKNPGAESELEQIILGAPNPRDFLARLRKLGDLPPDRAAIDHSLLLMNVPAKNLRPIATMAATGFGRVVLNDLGGGWSALACLDTRDPAMPFPEYVTSQFPSLRLGLRGRPALLLEWGQNGEAIATAVRKDQQIGYAAWNTGWDEFDDDHWSARDESAEAFLTLARTDAAPVEDSAALRPLVRQKQWPGNPLPELLAKLGHDPAVLDLMDSPHAVPGANIVEPASPRSVFWALMCGREVPPDAGRSTLGVELLFSLIWVAAGLILASAGVVSLVNGVGFDGDQRGFVEWVALAVGPLMVLLNGLQAWDAWSLRRSTTAAE